MLQRTFKCSCCDKVFPLPCSTKEYKWKLDNEFYCSYSCYSKEFDKKYQASTITANNKVSYSRGKVVDKGYERHGSR